VGTAAALAGAGWALRRQEPAPDPVVLDLWAMSFDTPSGGRLAMASLRGRPLVINFWATWCPPCVREMPALNRFARTVAARGAQVLGIAADQADNVRDFLAATPVSYPIALAGFAGIDLSRRLGNLSGGLPFTVLVDRAGQVAQRQIGEMTPERLTAWAEGIS
jgi:thiol-disulfide isomerase/thioredoxin